NGDKLVLTCDGNTVTVTKNGKKVNSFSYKGTRIIISANEVYYANTKVTYVDESFSSFNVTDKVTIRCIAENKFEIVKDGKTVKKATVKDVNGSKYVLEAMDKGMEITNTDNELMESIVVGNNYISVSGDKVVINGKTMRPPHSADIKAVTTTVTTTTTTATTTTTTSKKTEKKTETQTETVTEPVQEEQPSAPQPAEPTEPDSSTNMSNRNLSAETSEMLGYVNEVRKQYGLRELEGLELLDSAADVRANELLGNYSHDRPDGNSYITAIEETDLPEWRAAAENIAYGMNSMSTVKEAFDAWMDSPPHRENILNPDVRYMACAKATKSENGEYTYWEQLFYSDI
ncbi:MAG TPA: CAP domain-containing protein, partial [Ruminococcus bicirculans (ex Wegman et al. 2014)]|nr:CAP domain-containing protein [Ruminococcus bicirculans (ex Wegman et al. 2014)]